MGRPGRISVADQRRLAAAAAGGHAPATPPAAGAASPLTQEEASRVELWEGLAVSLPEDEDEDEDELDAAAAAAADAAEAAAALAAAAAEGHAESDGAIEAARAAAAAAAENAERQRRAAQAVLLTPFAARTKRQLRSPATPATPIPTALAPALKKARLLTTALAANIHGSAGPSAPSSFSELESTERSAGEASGHRGEIQRTAEQDLLSRQQPAARPYVEPLSAARPGAMLNVLCLVLGASRRSGFQTDLLIADQSASFFRVVCADAAARWSSRNVNLGHIVLLAGVKFRRLEAGPHAQTVEGHAFDASSCIVISTASEASIDKAEHAKLLRVAKTNAQHVITASEPLRRWAAERYGVILALGRATRPKIAAVQRPEPTRFERLADVLRPGRLDDLVNVTASVKEVTEGRTSSFRWASLIINDGGNDENIRLYREFAEPEHLQFLRELQHTGRQCHFRACVVALDYHSGAYRLSSISRRTRIVAAESSPAHLSSQDSDGDSSTVSTFAGVAQLLEDVAMERGTVRVPARLLRMVPDPVAKPFCARCGQLAHVQATGDSASSAHRGQRQQLVCPNGCVEPAVPLGTHVLVDDASHHPWPSLRRACRTAPPEQPAGFEYRVQAFDLELADLDTPRSRISVRVEGAEALAEVAFGLSSTALADSRVAAEVARLVTDRRNTGYTFTLDCRRELDEHGFAAVGGVLFRLIRLDIRLP